MRPTVSDFRRACRILSRSSSAASRSLVGPAHATHCGQKNGVARRERRLRPTLIERRRGITSARDSLDRIRTLPISHRQQRLAVPSSRRKYRTLDDREWGGPSATGRCARRIGLLMVAGRGSSEIGRWWGRDRKTMERALVRNAQQPTQAGLGLPHTRRGLSPAP